MKTVSAVVVLLLVSAASVGVVASLARASSPPTLPTDPAVPGVRDYFVRIEGLGGPATVNDQEGWIEADRFLPGILMPFSLDNKLRLGHLTFVVPAGEISRMMDKASEAHTRFESAVLETLQGGPNGKVVLQAKLSDVSISSVRPLLDKDGEPLSPPRDKVSLHFGQFDWVLPKGDYQMTYPTDKGTCPH